MHDLNTYALKRKIEFWKQQIGFIENGNIQFKARLTNILRKRTYKDHLDQLEEFQNRFLQLDDQITVLKHEVQEQLQELSLYDVTGKVLPTAGYVQEKLEERLVIMNGNFNRLNNDFNNFVLEHHLI